jgi:hypothetical protein
MSWKSKPSWYIVANKDRAVQAESQRSVAKHVGATVFETDGSHVLKLGQPDLVIDVIRKAANAVQHLGQRKVHRTYFSEPEVILADAKSEAPLQTSAEFVCAYSAIVDALTATIMNAQAGLEWLSAQPPDLKEVRRTLNNIADDGKRAGEIVVRLRVPMKGPPMDDALDS